MSLYRPPDGYPAIELLPPCPTITPVAPVRAFQRVQRDGGSQLANPRLTFVFDSPYPHPELYLEWQLYHCLTRLVAGPFADGLVQYGAGRGGYAGFRELQFPRGEITSSGLAQWFTESVNTLGFGAPAGGQELFLLYPGPELTIAEPGFTYGVDFCAYHSSIIGGIPFGVMPYPGTPPNCGESLGLTDLEILCMLSSHELAEAMTDAVPGEGWEGSEGEIDDFAPCLWSPVPITIDGYRYRIQAYWDQAFARCWVPPTHLAPPAPQPVPATGPGL